MPYQKGATIPLASVESGPPRPVGAEFTSFAPRVSTAKERPTTGVEGDPTKATPELGKMFIGWKIDDAVNQIHESTCDLARRS
jgi:hypothetical protein